MTARTNLINNIIKGIAKDETFTCHFTKRTTGEERTMVCRLRANDSKYNGKGMRYDPLARGLLPVFDLAKDDWRMINLETITKLWINGKEIVISDSSQC